MRIVRLHSHSPVLTVDKLDLAGNALIRGDVKRKEVANLLKRIGTIKSGVSGNVVQSACDGIPVDGNSSLELAGEFAVKVGLSGLRLNRETA